MLLVLQGLPAEHFAVVINFETPYGTYGTGHNVAYAGGMLLDPEINVAFDIGSFAELRAMTPATRLEQLLAADKVYGFYDWLNNPAVRREQIVRGLDGGVLSWFYRFILEGMDQGSSRIWALNFQPP
jgi:hypothetical protein